MTPDFTLEPWESLLGNLGQAEPDASESQSLSLDARYPPPTPKHTQALELCPLSHTRMLSHRYIRTQTHKNTDVRCSPAYTHSQTLEYTNT